MIPPRGFKSEIFPLRHNVKYAFGLSVQTTTMNSAMCTLIRHTNDIITTGAGVPKMIVVNPRNTAYVSDAGSAVCNMSIIDRLTLSIRFNMTEYCDTGEVASAAYGDSIHKLHLTWRPVFFSFPEKLDAADDDTGTTVATILGLTKDATFEDVVPLTTNKLPVGGGGDLNQPASTVNIAEVFGDFNMTTNVAMEDHPWDETLFQDAMRRYTNKGALKACVGRTRHVNLTRSKPFMNYYLDKFVPRSVRRVQPYTFMAIQINVPTVGDIGSEYNSIAHTASKPHVGVKLICNYHEWNQGHYQDPEGLPPTSA